MIFQETRAHKNLKAHINKVGVTGIQYFPDVWYFLRMHQKEWYQLCIVVYYIFVLPPHHLRQPPLFCRLIQIILPPRIGRARDFVGPHLPPTSKQGQYDDENKPR